MHRKKSGKIHKKFLTVIIPEEWPGEKEISSFTLFALILFELTMTNKHNFVLKTTIKPIF